MLDQASIVLSSIVPYRRSAPPRPPGRLPGGERDGRAGVGRHLGWHGLRPDGTIWGGEFLLGDASGFTRVAHLRPFRLLGGDAAVYEPKRVALALLCEMYGDAALDMDDLAPVRAFSISERHLLSRMLARGVNAPITTSAGRLFDGVAALIGLQPGGQLRGSGGDGAGVRGGWARRWGLPGWPDERRRTKDEGAR